jgi:hypothetical protein
MLALEPGCAKTEKRSPSGKHIQCRDRLYQHSWMAIGNAANHRSQAHALRCASQVRKGAVPLKHLILDRSHGRDLKEVIHDGDEAKTGVIRCPRHLSQALPQRSRAARPGEARYMQSYAHERYSSLVCPAYTENR